MNIPLARLVQLSRLRKFTRTWPNPGHFLTLLARAQQATEERSSETPDSLSVASLFPSRSYPSSRNRQYKNFNPRHPLHYPGGPSLPGPRHSCWTDPKCQGTAERWVGPSGLVRNDSWTWQERLGEWVTEVNGTCCHTEIFSYHLALKKPSSACPQSASLGDFVGTNQATQTPLSYFSFPCPQPESE